MKLIFTAHAVRRMFERGITPENVRAVSGHGEVIERYDDDRPFPSRLVLGWAGGQPVHAVLAKHPSDEIEYVVTVYRPDPSEWAQDFRTRRKP